MKSILERIIQISENEKITISKIERLIGASKGVLHKAIQNKTDISSKWIVLIVENFTQYNPEWLITGSGEMLRTSGAKIETTEQEKYIIELQKEKIEMLQEKLRECQKENKLAKIGKLNL